MINDREFLNQQINLMMEIVEDIIDTEKMNQFMQFTSTILI